MSYWKRALQLKPARANCIVQIVQAAFYPFGEATRMPKLPKGLADVSTSAPPALPDGKYLAKIDDVEVGKSKKKKDMITVAFKLYDPTTVEIDGKVVQVAGRIIKNYYVLEQNNGEVNEGGYRDFKRLVIAALNSEDKANDPDFDTDELEGEDVMLVLKQDSYEDEDDGSETPTNRIKKVLSAA